MNSDCRITLPETVRNTNIRKNEKYSSNNDH